MRRLMRFTSILVVLLMICGCSLAEDVTKENLDIEYTDNAIIASLNTNEYYAKPLIVFFPGSGECHSVYSSANFIQNYNLYDDLDCDIIIVAMRDSGTDYRSWQGVCDDLVEYLLPLVERLSEDDEFPIIIDTVSFGGYGGCYFAAEAQDNNLWIKELNLADACNTGVVTPDMVRDIAETGVQVNAYASTGGNNISRSTRNVIDELDGTRGFSGEVFSVSHGAVLAEAINESGLHEELQEQ